MIDAARVAAAFTARHGGEPRLFCAPGRVNLIGEHTDYNEGWVLPIAIDRGTVVAARAREDRSFVVSSLNNRERVEIDLDRPGPKRRGSWVDYVEGVARALGVERLCGADVVLEGDVPAGAGLSSSAAIEVAVGLALLSLADQIATRADGLLEAGPGTALALAAQEAEHDYVGTRCGIMDQLVAALGRADHALLIDCRSLLATQVRFVLPDTVVLVCDSKVKHELATSAYNDRRAQCEEAARLLGVRALRDVDEAELHELPAPLRSRARHVVTENARTLALAAALERGALDEVGAAMYASHASLRDDYEVSCPELDLLVDLARQLPGVYGARMTGGGFGGCTVNLVARAAAEATAAAIVRGYERVYGRAPDVFVTRAADGARVLGKVHG